MAREGLEVGRRVGLIHRWLLGNACEAAVHTGDWDWALAASGELDSDRLTHHERNLVLPVAIIHAARGNYQEAETWLRGLDEPGLLGSDPAYRANLLHVRGQLSLIRGDYELAARDAATLANSQQHPFDAMGLLLRARTALWTGDARECGESLEKVDELNMHWRFVQITAMTLKAGLAALEGRNDEAAQRYVEVARAWREDLQLPLDLALCQMEFANLLPDHEGAPAAAAEAREIFTRLNSPPLLARLDAAVGRRSLSLAEAGRP
jgi:hypothetical protein